jgi:hypothetical protein
MDGSILASLDESNELPQFSIDDLAKKKRTRRNAIRPNSVDSDQLREFSLRHQMNSVQISNNETENRGENKSDETFNICSSSPSTPILVTEDNQDIHRRKKRKEISIDEAASIDLQAIEKSLQKQNESTEEEKPETDS